MRVLVTGGAGFIGSNFVRLTSETRPDFDLIVLDSLTYAGSLQNLEGLEDKSTFVHGDIRDDSLVDKLIRASDLVVNFAAETHNDNSLTDPKPFISTNVEGTANLISACTRAGRRFHHVSTDEVYGDLPLDSTEKFTTQSPYRPSSPYSASKASSDHLVRAWVRSFGLDATISNCSNNYGPNQNVEKLIPNIIHRILKGDRPKIYGTGLNIRDWIHVDDHNEGIWRILESGKSGETYHLGASCERSNLDIVRTILNILGKAENEFDFVADRSGHDLRYAIDATKTIDELGWSPRFTDFESSLKDVVLSYLK